MENETRKRNKSVNTNIFNIAFEQGACVVHKIRSSYPTNTHVTATHNFSNMPTRSSKGKTFDKKSLKNFTNVRSIVVDFILIKS